MMTLERARLEYSVGNEHNSGDPFGQAAKPDAYGAAFRDRRRAGVSAHWHALRTTRSPLAPAITASLRPSPSVSSVASTVTSSRVGS